MSKTLSIIFQYPVVLRHRLRPHRHLCPFFSFSRPLVLYRRPSHGRRPPSGKPNVRSAVLPTHQYSLIHYFMFFKKGGLLSRFFLSLDVFRKSHIVYHVLVYNNVGALWSARSTIVFFLFFSFFRKD